MDSIWFNHHHVGGRGQPTREDPLGKLDPSIGFAKVKGNVVRQDIEKAARMAGLDVIVNAVVNSRRETIGLFVGDLLDAHREAVKFAKEVYATRLPDEVDVIVANAYSKASEGLIAVQSSRELVKKEGIDLVIICNTPEGQICHYLSRSFGKFIGGRVWGQRKNLPFGIRRMIVLGSYIDKASLDWLGPPDLIMVADNWPHVLEILKVDQVRNPRVAVIPDSTLQYFP